ncbi:MAG: ABC transporter ATP-binding protein [Chloroflexota bacterium]
MKHLVRIEGLSFSYPDGQHALQCITLSVYQGENVALIGPNGAGKSTLLLHLNGVLRSNGRVTVFDTPVQEKTLKLIRCKVGLVFQEPDDQLFSPTVFDDVAFGPLSMGCLEAEVRERVSQALAWVGMSGFEERAPHHLSVGQKKRIAIATVLALRPELLVLDEPTSSLDPGSKHALLDLLHSLPQTKVVASHDLEVVRALCQRVVVMDEGRIVADGPTTEILGDTLLLQAHSLAPHKRPQPASLAVAGARPEA